MNFRLVCILILGQLSISQIDCLTKSYFALNQWLENPKIWSAKRLPCKLDTVILPDNVAIYLDKSLTASKIILPKNGILILDQDNWIKQENESTCSKGQDNKLIIRTNDWFDTSNWNVKYHTFEYRGDDELTNPIPHIQRIPCQKDEVRFKAKSTFKLLIDLDNENYKLRNLFVNNKNLNSRDFERYTKSKIGKLQFKINGQLPFYVTNTDDQSDHSVQICQDNFNSFLNKICRNVVNKCPKLDCLRPIRPTGYCCELCGSVVSIDQSNYFTIKNDKDLDYEFIENTLINIHLDKYQETNFFLNKVSDKRIEIIILDQIISENLKRTNQNIQSKNFAQELMNFFKKEKFYQPYTIEHQYSEFLDEQTGKGLYLVIFVLMILVISILLFIYSNQLPYLNSIAQQVQSNLPTNCRTIATDSPFTFIRFSSDHEENSLEMGLSQPHQSSSRQSNDRANDRNGLKLRTKNDSISSSISNSILFTLLDEKDEQDVSFHNPYFKKEVSLEELKNNQLEE